METKGSHTLLSYDGKKRLDLQKFRKSIWLLRAEQNAHQSACLWKGHRDTVEAPELSKFHFKEKSSHAFSVLPQTFLGQLLEMLPRYGCEREVRCGI